MICCSKILFYKLHFIVKKTLEFTALVYIVIILGISILMKINSRKSILHVIPIGSYAHYK